MGGLERFYLGLAALGVIGLTAAWVRDRSLRRHGEDRQAVLSAVRKLAPDGYSNTIEREAQRTLGRKLQFGGLWFHLAKLEKEGRIGARWQPGQFPRRKAYYVTLRGAAPSPAPRGEETV